ncbi:MAG TPA: hypothetical protein VIW67_12330 [Terriglobales bacterium]|jgi:hypothetical protein
MAAGKGQGSSAAALKTRRRVQRDEVDGAVVLVSKKLQELRNRQKQCELLRSVGGALYEEMDKLSKKSPVDPVTTLALGEVNNFLAQTKALGKDDSFIQRLNEFVPAGELPENRDVVFVLKLALEGLKRVKETLSSLIGAASARVREARTVLLALDYYLQHEHVPDRNAFAANDSELPDEWELGNKFDFAHLDRIDIKSYFAEEKTPDESDDETDDE